MTDDTERPLRDMSDGAIRKAEQSVDNAMGSAEYALLMLSGPMDELPDPKVCAADAVQRLQEVKEQLRYERKQRELHTDTNHD